MPRRLSHFAKSLIALFLLVLIWWVLPLAVKSFFRATFYEFQAPAATGLSYMRDLQNFWAVRNRPKRELIEAGQEMARRSALYSLKVQENEALRAEVRRLEQLLALPGYVDYRYEVARVSQRDLNAWWQQITIRKGKRHGIRAGQAVVYAGGVVGRVKEVHAYTSIIELVSSPAFRMAAHFEGDERPVTYQGGINPPLQRARGRANNVQPDIVASAREPVRLVSSRLGGVFPDGLTIGYVSDFEQSPDGLFQSGEVFLNADLMSLKEVAVLVPIVAETYGATGVSGEND